MGFMARFHKFYHTHFWELPNTNKAHLVLLWIQFLHIEIQVRTYTMLIRVAMI